MSKSRETIRHIKGKDPVLVDTLNTLIDTARGSSVPPGQHTFAEQTGPVNRSKAGTRELWFRCQSDDEVEPFGIVEVYDAVQDDQGIILKVKIATSDDGRLFAGNEDYKLFADSEGWVKLITSYEPVLVRSSGSGFTFLDELGVDDDVVVADASGEILRAASMWRDGKIFVIATDNGVQYRSSFTQFGECDTLDCVGPILLEIPDTFEETSVCHEGMLGLIIEFGNAECRQQIDPDDFCDVWGTHIFVADQSANICDSISVIYVTEPFECVIHHDVGDDTIDELIWVLIAGAEGEGAVLYLFRTSDWPDAFFADCGEPGFGLALLSYVTTSDRGWCCTCANPMVMRCLNYFPQYCNQGPARICVRPHKNLIDGLNCGDFDFSLKYALEVSGITNGHPLPPGYDEDDLVCPWANGTIILENASICGPDCFFCICEWDGPFIPEIGARWKFQSVPDPVCEASQPAPPNTLSFSDGSSCLFWRLDEVPDSYLEPLEFHFDAAASLCDGTGTGFCENIPETLILYPV